MTHGPALSNPMELINLADIAGLGIGPAAGRIWPGFSALAAGRSRTHIWSYRSSWWGRAARERRSGNVSGNSLIGSARGWLAPQGARRLRRPWSRGPVSRGDFERLCHVAINFQI